MELLFTILTYLFYGFFGLLALLVLVAIVFGKRIRKQWEYEADFLDESGREFGEFEIELSRIQKEEPDYTLKAKLVIRHSALRANQPIQVYIDETLVLEDMTRKDGSILLRTSNLQVDAIEVSAGQVCRVVVGSTEMFSAELRRD